MEMSLIKLFAVIILSVQVSSQRDVIYGTPNLLNDDLSDVDHFNGRGLTASSNLQFESLMTGAPQPTARGRVVGNSILEPSPGILTRNEGGGARPMIRYLPQPQQQNTRTMRVQQSPSRPIMTGPSVGTIRNGIDETEVIDDEVEQPMTISSTSSGRGTGEDNMEVSKFVSVFVSPPEPIQSRRPKPIKMTPQKLHYNILFIKAPNMLPESQELQIPPHPQTKTMVYVLLKRPDVKDMLKITQSPTPAPQKPEVFFIRYKNEQKQDGKSDKNGMNAQNENQDEVRNDPGSVVKSQQQRRGEAIKLKQFGENIGGVGGLSSRGNLNLGGYENSETSDNDFSSRETYDENELLLSSRQQQYNQNQQQRFVQSGSEYSFTPVNSRYGIVS